MMRTAKPNSQALLLWIGSFSVLCGQSLGLNASNRSFGNDYFENFSVNFGLGIASGDGQDSKIVGLLPSGQFSRFIGFQQGHSTATLPAFGGNAPGVGAQFGFANRSRSGGGFSLGLNLARGSSRTYGSVTPSVVVPNGGIGYFGNGTLNPFVTGIVPVIGSGVDNAVSRAVSTGQIQTNFAPKISSPQRITKKNDGKLIDENQTSGSVVSSAQVSASGVDEIFARKQKEKRTKRVRFENLVRDSWTAAKSGNLRLARVLLRKAVRLTDKRSEKRYLESKIRTLYGQR